MDRINTSIFIGALDLDTLCSSVQDMSTVRFLHQRSELYDKVYTRNLDLLALARNEESDRKKFVETV